MSTSEIRFDGVRVRYDSTKSYDELVAALLADIGERPVAIDDIGKTSDTWDSYEQRVQSYVGPSGFTLFGLFAPVEVLIADEPGGHSSLTYVKPSALMVVEPNVELLSAATELDAKLAALAAKVTRG